MISKFSFFLKIAIYLPISIVLIGCSSTLETATKIGQIISDPSTPVGPIEDRPSTMALTLLTDNNVNPNDDGEPSPLELQVIYLSEDSKLLASYYEQFEGDSLKNILGKNYISHQDYAVQPDQYKVISDITLDKDTRYLGVIAYYSDPEKAQWRKVIPIKGKGYHYNILVYFKKWTFDIKEYKE